MRREYIKNGAIVILLCFILVACTPKWNIPITVHKNEKQEQAK